MLNITKVSPTVQRSKRFADRSSDAARFAYLYLFTGKHQTSAGAFRLSPGFAQDDLGWDQHLFSNTRFELSTNVSARAFSWAAVLRRAV